MGRNEYGLGAQSNITLVVRAKPRITGVLRGFDAWSTRGRVLVSMFRLLKYENHHALFA